jgi:hypothetical protein
LLQRVLRAAGLSAPIALGALCHCGSPSGGEATEVSRAAIVGGLAIDDPLSPVLFERGPQGFCSAVLVAPTLALTARHCVADLTPGDVECTSLGELAPSSPGGALAPDDLPSAISFYTAAHVIQAYAMAPPDATAAQIFSTQSPNTCRDDLAFVVLTQAIPGLSPLPIRLEGSTRLGENVSIWGYGLTDEAGAIPSLRVRHGAQIVGIGPDAPTLLTQAAPVRAVRLGPGSLTCNGDSGGPIVSDVTGAVLAVVSFGVQAGANQACAPSSNDDTTGPLLSEYTTLALSAFAAAGASPIVEANGDAGAAPDIDAAAPFDAGDASDPLETTTADDGAEASPTGAGDGPPEAQANFADASETAAQEASESGGSPAISAEGGSCAVASAPSRGAGAIPSILAGLAMVTMVRRRRPRS